MTTRLLAAALFSAAIICAAQAWADVPQASLLPPVYPAPDQQAPNSFGAVELMHCPDGYKLSFEGQEPNCVPMTAQELAESTK